MTNRKNTVNKIKTKIKVVEFFKNTYRIKINEQTVYVIDVIICHLGLQKIEEIQIRKPVFFLIFLQIFKRNSGKKFI